MCEVGITAGEPARGEAEIEQAVAECAPDLMGVEVEGLEAASLVQIKLVVS